MPVYKSSVKFIELLLRLYRKDQFHAFYPNLAS